MKSVFVVQHLHTLPGEREDVKFIGVYSTAQAAHAAVERLAVQPGFRDYPKLIDPTRDEDEQGFYVDEYQLDQDNWCEGYVTI